MSRIVSITPTAVERELRAQVDRALAAGIDVTHLDAHMGSTLAPELCDVYLRLGRDYQLPVLMTTTLDAYSAKNHLEGATEDDYHPFVEQARQDGQPLFDVVLETSQPLERQIDHVVQHLSGQP